MTTMSRWLWRVATLVTLLLGWSAGARAADFLPVDEAFQLAVTPTADGAVKLSFTLAPKTHLYRDRFSVEADPATVKPTEAAWPTGVRKFDEGFGKEVEVYYGEVSSQVKLPASVAPGTPVSLVVGYQGCSDEGLCYPPQKRSFRLSVAEGGRVIAVQGADGAAVSAAPASAPAASAAVTSSSSSASSSGRIEAALASGNIFKIAGVFLVAGLLLSFTPCVLPMVPILSSIIVGDGPVGRLRGFLLALSYSQGMALVYTLLGMGAGLAGEGLAASLQNPWVLGTFGALMVLLSLSMFGAYELQMPSFIQGHLTNHSQKLQGGSLLGVFIMGALSALIVGPCVTGPLAGALVYLSQTRDVVLGGVALYALACGMSVPLLLVGLSAGTLLPQAGMWMESVKTFFGLLLLGVAWWLVSPVMSPAVQVWSLGGLLALGAAFTGGFDTIGPQASLRHRAFKALGMVLALLATIEILGALAGAQSPWDPLRPFMTRAQAQGGAASEASLGEALPFKRVKSVAELDAAVADAAKAGRPVMLDFYADWCVACKEFARFTFSDARVQARLRDVALLQADVTANSAEDKALLKRFNLFGPPGIIFYNAQGQEQSAARVVGFEEADPFIQSMERAGLR